MKKGGRIFSIFLISIFIIFLSIELISSSDFEIRTRTNCQTAPWNNIIMGLSDASNAHGQVWNASSYGGGITDYPYVLCSNETGTHDCSIKSHPVYGAEVPENKIIGLYSLTDSHAEGTSGTLYTNNVCYQGLVCKTVADTCPSDYPIDLLNLSSSTNAHLGTGAGYSTAICCQYTGFAGASCALVNATFGYTSTQENGPVPLIVEGTNCPAQTAINYSIWRQNYFLGVPTTVDLFNWSIGTFDRLSWIAKLVGGDTSDTFFFKAKTLVTGSEFSSMDGNGNKTLSVSRQTPDYCADKVICDAYKDSQNCSQDPCTPKAAATDPGCTAGLSCACTWNSATSKCELTTTYVPQPIVTPNCFTMCYNYTLQEYFNYPGNSCPAGTSIQPNGICDASDGCYSADCVDGAQASCTAGATCSSGKCNTAGQTCQNESGCGSGYTLCYNQTIGLTFCNAGNGCPSTEQPPVGPGVCGPGEGCSSAACTPGGPTKTDSCASGSYCQAGACYSPLAVSGGCIFHETTVNDCSANGQLVYSWTSDWTGAPADRPDYCADGRRVAPCAAQAALPFDFGTTQIILTILLILIIYFLIIYRKKIFKHSRKKKRK
ncbi:MAG TPA: hypothetical protein VMC80_02985 [Patescibacteria group bacterium]|nr:hypothetical protein [Patescibacteria group bacterium]